MYVSSVQLFNGIFVPNVIKRFQESKLAPNIWIKRYPPRVQTFCTIRSIVARGVLLRSIQVQCLLPYNNIVAYLDALHTLYTSNYDFSRRSAYFFTDVMLISVEKSVAVPICYTINRGMFTCTEYFYTTNHGLSRCSFFLLYNKI